MKKVFFVLFIVMMNFGYSKDLDKYESKRVFDKLMDAIVTDNYEKYKDDKEMTRALEDMKEAEEKEYRALIHDFVKNNRYEVISVEEELSKSTLKVRVVYISYDKVSIEEYFNEMYTINEEIGVKDDEAELTDEQTFYVYRKLREKFKDSARMSEKIIDVYMNKKNGLWDVDLDENIVLFTTMFPISTEFMELITEN